MTDNDEPQMPWAGIAKATAAVATTVGLVLTGMCASALRAERREMEDSQRFRWTDKNRWE